MIRIILLTIRALSGIAAGLIAMLMFVFAFVAASATQHKLDGTQRRHLEAAVQFVQESKLASGRMPTGEEFADWAKQMDAKGFRFDGNGYNLSPRCGSKASEFCIFFSTGDGFVTYKSWQQSMDEVEFDDSPLPLALGLLFAGVVMVLLSAFLLTIKTPHARSNESK